MLKAKLVRLSRKGNEFNVKSKKPINGIVFSGIKNYIAKKYWAAGSYTIRFEADKKKNKVYLNAFGNDHTMIIEVNDVKVNNNEFIVSESDTKQFKLVSTNRTHSEPESIKKALNKVKEVVKLQKATYADLLQELENMKKKVGVK